MIEPAELAGTEFPMEPETTVGRSSGCTIVLDQQYVSQVHTRLFQRDDQVFAEDLGSTNGTWVNGVRAMGQMPARAGDRIQIAEGLFLDLFNLFHNSSAVMLLQPFRLF